MTCVHYYLVSSDVCDCGAMGDLFHEGVPDEFIDKVFAVMTLTPQHTYLLLTKRPERMRAYLKEAAPRIDQQVLNDCEDRCTGTDAYVLSYRWPLLNVWLGVSCENQRWADERIPLLLDTPAAHRWVSLEPLLGPVDLHPGHWIPPLGGGPKVNVLRPWETPPPSLDWVVIGGESGSHARPCDLGWIRDINQQCEAAGVKRYVKQLGASPMLPFTESGHDEWLRGRRDLGWRLGDFRGNSDWPGALGYAFRLRDRKGENPDEWPLDLRVREMPEMHRLYEKT